MNVVVSRGLQQVPPIFVDRGVPVEYELIRSLGTVTDQQKKRIGVLATDAQVMGGRMSMTNPEASGSWQIVKELEKQYEVVPVEPSKLVTSEKEYVKAAFDIDPADAEKMIVKGMELLNIKSEDRKKLSPKQIDECKAKVFAEAKNQLKYDVLLAVQPSSLGPEDMQRFIAAVRAGQPTAIFEDPFCRFMPDVPGTSMPRQSPGGMQGMMMGMRAPPKGDIKPLWELLGVDVPGDEIIYQDYNPYPKSIMFPKEFTFVDKGELTAKAGKDDAAESKKKAGEPESKSADSKNFAFNPDNEITKGLQQVLFPYIGSIADVGSKDKQKDSTLEFIALAKTGRRTGSIRLSDLLRMTPMGPQGMNENPRRTPTSLPYVLAGEIRGKVEAAEEKPTPGADAKDANAKDADAKGADAKNGEKKPAAKATDVHVVLVGDIDMLADAFFRLREAGTNNPEMDIDFNFDNVTFVLNILDEMAGDPRYIAIRTHRPKYRTLQRIDEETEQARENAAKAREEDNEEFEKGKAKVEADFQKQIEDIRNTKNVSRDELAQRVGMAMISGQQQMDRTIEELQRNHDIKIEKVEREREENIHNVQAAYKFTALLLPPIFPLAVALGVFIYRRKREREGVARSRLR